MLATIEALNKENDALVEPKLREVEESINSITV